MNVIRRYPKLFTFSALTTVGGIASYRYFTGEKAQLYLEIMEGNLTEDMKEKLDRKEYRKTTFMHFPVLEWAIRMNNVEAVNYLLFKNYEVTQWTKEIAMMNMNSEILKTMMKHGHDIKTWKYENYSIFQYYQHKNPVMLEWLEKVTGNKTE